MLRTRGQKQYARTPAPKADKGKGKARANDNDEAEEEDEADDVEDEADELRHLETFQEEDAEAAKTYDQQEQAIKSQCVLHYGDKGSPEPIDYRWGILICDEAQYLRRVGSSFWNMVALIRNDMFWAVSATPLLDSIADIRGLAKLAWWFTKLPVALNANAFSEPAAYTSAEYNPFDQADGTYVGYPFLNRANPQHKSAIELVDSGFNVWYIFPEILHKIGSKTLGEDRAISVVSHILRHLQSRRTMESPITLPDDTVVHPGDGIPGTIVETREVRHVGGYRVKVAKSVNRQLAKFFGAVRKRKEAGYVLIDPDEDEPAAVAKTGEEKAAAKEESGEAGSTRYRVLELLSFDYRNERLLRDTRTMQVRGDSVSKALAGRKVKLGFKLADLDPRRPTLGVEHCETIISKDRDAGMTFLWLMTTKEPRMLCPADRMALLSFALSESPVLLGGLKAMWEWIKEGHRVIMMVDNPWTQQ